MTSHEPSGYAENRLLLSENATRAALGGISRPTLFRIRQRGEIAVVRVGRRVFFRPADVEAYIERNREAASIP